MIRKIIKPIFNKFPALITFYRNSRDLLDQNSASKPTPWGFTLAGNDAMSSGTFEPQETIIFNKMLKEVDAFVNVGANIGYYCCLALKQNKDVIAVEPIPRNIHYLLKNLKSNGWEKSAEVFPVALGAETDILQIYGGNTGASLIQGWASIPDNYVTNVPVSTLDRLLGDKIKGKKALILVDIEGAELMMLQGSDLTLKSEPRPIWMMEITTTEHQPNGAMNPNFIKTFDVFFENGYDAYTGDEENIKIDKPYIESVVSKQQQLKTHNFIFK